ncbi:MAG: endo alpha-1,4 polygalactosaminidase [Acidimicrobiales bacterium]
MSGAGTFVARVTEIAARHRRSFLASIGLVAVAGIIGTAVYGPGDGSPGRFARSLPFVGESDDDDPPGAAPDGTGKGSDGEATSPRSKVRGSGDPGAAIDDGGSPTGSGPDTLPASDAGKPVSSTKPGQSSKTPTTWWKPGPGVTWQWQLSALPIDTDVVADVYDVDLFDVDETTVAALHKQGRKVICYLSAGSYEDWRPDAGSFPEALLGNNNGWPGERWLDIRALDVLMPIMEARFDLCRAKGFDAIEVDNVDGYTNGTGFPLSPADQLAYNRRLAKAAHERGLAIALKNDVDQIAQLVDDFDLAINEECAAYNECGVYKPFINANKAVLHAEYNLEPDKFCGSSSALGLSSIRKNLELDAWVQTCP